MRRKVIDNKVQSWRISPYTSQLSDCILMQHMLQNNSKGDNVVGARRCKTLQFCRTSVERVRKIFKLLSQRRQEHAHVFISLEKNFFRNLNHLSFLSLHVIDLRFSAFTNRHLLSGNCMATKNSSGRRLSRAMKIISP